MFERRVCWKRDKRGKRVKRRNRCCWMSESERAIRKAGVRECVEFLAGAGSVLSTWLLDYEPFGTV